MELTLHGTPADNTIYLTWEVNASLSITSTWEISHDGLIGDPPSPITDLTEPTRAYTLTRLSNYVPYTFTLSTVLGSTPFLTDTITIMPTDIRVLLPVALRE